MCKRNNSVLSPQANRLPHKKGHPYRNSRQLKPSRIEKEFESTSRAIDVSQTPQHANQQPPSSLQQQKDRGYIMAQVFFNATKNALNSITELFQLVHPLRTSMHYTRSAVAQIAAVNPNANNTFSRLPLIQMTLSTARTTKPLLLIHRGKNKKNSLHGSC